MAEEELRPLEPTEGWKHSSGPAYILCAIHRVGPTGVDKEANMVVGGMSMCLYHADLCIGLLIGGYDAATILSIAYDGNLEELMRQIRDSPTPEEQNGNAG